MSPLGVSVRVTEPCAGVEGTALYEAVDASGQLVPGARLAIIGLMHGDEPVGDRTLTRLEPQFTERLIAGSVLTVRANLEAARLGLRNTPDGVNMNRLWDRDTLARLQVDEPTCYEERRVAELAPWILSCAAILDLHSTSRPAPPFMLFRDDQHHALLAMKLGVERIVTGLYEASIVEGGLCSNAGLTVGEPSERVGFTFEAGQHTNPANAERAFEVAVRLLGLLGLWSELLPPSTVEPAVYEIIDRVAQAPSGTPPWRFVGYQGGEAGSSRSGLPRQLASFEDIEADEIILRRSGQVVERARVPFTMLMPAPTAAPSDDLYFVAQRRHGGLGRQAGPRTDEQARREAYAVEHMLDLLEDDDFQRGTTWLSFDSRHVLDLCADQIAHTLRLPQGHPHRRIAVVGRGDWGGDDSERRAGQRYRHAMRLAVREGVELDRIQLMRGASMGWLDSLTSPGMRWMLTERSQIPGARPVRFWVSARQPHAVSILVLGDLDRGLREGDTRHVRVVLVIEAANVEPDEDTAQVRSVRAGLVSARVDFLRATSRLLHALKNEHRRLLELSPLSEHAGLRAVTASDGAISPTEREGELDGMRDGLRRLQWQLWEQALRPALSKTIHLETPQAVGEWVASTMASTGIRDVAAVRALVREDGDGRWFVDAQSLDPGMVEAPRDEAGPHRATPPPALRAVDINADIIERWIGWKRFLRGAQVVPDNRGKDVDLAFHEGEIHRHFERMYRHAVRLGRQLPGRVMVVVAGDGQTPSRERPSGTAGPVMWAHRQVLLEPSVRYLRIQHAQSTHLSWMKDVLGILKERPAIGAPVGLQWEAEHGSSVNVLLVCVRDADAPEIDDDVWTLDGWSIEHCGVVLSELEGGGREYQFAIFTELLPGPAGRINQELLHFGRAHCEGLLAQGGARARGPGVGAFEDAVIAQVEGWIEQARAAYDALDGPCSGRWIAARLGLADHRLARSIALQVPLATSAREAARAIWEEFPRWPGPLWEQLGPVPVR